MTWHAKPSGAYNFSDPENVDNSMEIFNTLNNLGWDAAAIAGVCANSMYEGGLNPWRWQNDTVNTALGYGMWQWTPSTEYTSLPGATPNFSTTSQTAGATPEDGARQVQALYENDPAKWTTSCWRSYWDTSAYPDYYAKTRYIINTWGSNNKITLSQYSQINDPAYAADCFLACFEGPGAPNYQPREEMAARYYERFTGVTPPTPPTPPTPDPPPVTTDSTYWILKRLADIQNTNLLLK